MDKLDQALKKTFSGFMAQTENKSRGKELNEKRSKFYLQVKLAFSEGKKEECEVKELINTFKEGEVTEALMIAQLCEGFIKTLQ